MQVFKNNKGFTLIEILIALSFSAIILMTLSTYLNFAYRQTSKQIEGVAHNYHTRFAMSYIEKTLREMDQTRITFHRSRTTFEGFNSQEKHVRVDLSGNQRNQFNTLLYFNRSTNQIRVNMRNEHNVLATFIEDIRVTEIIEGKLIEIKVISSKNNDSVKTKIYIPYKVR
ncbi:prepilin-type N-terminal cleavage/methylation domain-containing protein [Serpentinicella sp. ANB-PHB4]|uniref:PulJ/GspJ family protein n=1 Tax=Serpentinicella sp. ANB-PHB4 TaxID=3074076 RepID=UPI0028618A4A|nr:prepilin-type N-terminal cleavage/methylation domain-containing protein [Serpentinicella sp. ANB-PHB4]MDR5658207.1 prepilin-type N-terminal cleavage/methylation domain-containing protein [Serpentinicella sp. ANB-PHB4]